tara:strand:- start:331 stop:765 length:435 start_codon:yes stop_codon:yes gene_type:complete
LQTFLPYSDLSLSAACLDDKRLGKQRVEAMQIHNVVSGKRTGGGWLNHPAVLMWRGYADALAFYHNVIIDEWVRRGFRNNMEYLPLPSGEIIFPEWFGDERVHSSHRSNLLRKDEGWYGQFGWGESSDLEYFWPVRKGEVYATT